MPSVTITLTVELREGFISDVLITAFDGNYGGCWYWAEPGDLYDNSWLTVAGNQWKSVAIKDIYEDGPDPQDKVVDVTVVAEGIRLALSQTGPKVSDAIRKAIYLAVVNEDAGEVDSDCADVIVQLGLFGEIVYG